MIEPWWNSVLKPWKPNCYYLKMKEEYSDRKWKLELIFCSVCYLLPVVDAVQLTVSTLRRKSACMFFEYGKQNTWKAKYVTK